MKVSQDNFHVRINTLFVTSICFAKSIILIVFLILRRFYKETKLSAQRPVSNYINSIQRRMSHS